ncbi:hypothetical protein K3740_11720 [Ruegeria conchae]|uniref:hypothetical protein n=1 Tax=Ruegeria conchae TaxID=981384 RepID=UPI0021A41A9B|nr:hypothetical protein [Ruegeria conchae]UWR01736.1 hypothetical protein K3740_11720 [Ruegeria conchae]
MANKRLKPEEIVQKLRQVDVLVGQGMMRVDAIREVCIWWRNPIFGAVFETDQQIAVALPNGQRMMVGLPLANLLTFLESIQSE